MFVCFLVFPDNIVQVIFVGCFEYDPLIFDKTAVGLLNIKRFVLVMYVEGKHRHLVCPLKTLTKSNLLLEYTIFDTIYMYIVLIICLLVQVQNISGLL